MASTRSSLLKVVVFFYGVHCCTPVFALEFGARPADVARICSLTLSVPDTPTVLCNVDSRLPAWSHDTHSKLRATLREVYTKTHSRIHVILMDAMVLEATPRRFAEQVLKLVSPNYHNDALVLVSTAPPRRRIEIITGPALRRIVSDNAAKQLVDTLRPLLQSQHTDAALLEVGSYFSQWLVAGASASDSPPGFSWPDWIVCAVALVCVFGISVRVYYEKRFLRAVSDLNSQIVTSSNTTLGQLSVRLDDLKQAYPITAKNFEFELCPQVGIICKRVPTSSTGGSGGSAYSGGSCGGASGGW